jgi:ATP phosphoribosyltransferase
MDTILRIAIQKKGRLSEKSLQLLKEAGIGISNGTSKLKTQASNFPLEVLFLRDDDIPQYVADGVAQAGILGENVVAEKAYPVTTELKLGFAKCRLSLAIPKEVDYPGLKWFDGKKIATTYPVILQKFLEKQSVNARPESISGSVEVAPGIGLADGICDIVSTGSTLFTNGLREVETVMLSEAVLVSSPQMEESKRALLDQLLFRMQAVIPARKRKYILLNAPNEAIPEICRLLPGMKSPTVMPLAEEGWSSLHTVVHEQEFWDVIDQLKKLGAEGILVTNIEKMIL